MWLLWYGIRCKSWEGVVSLSPVVEGLKRVEKGVDKTASELAIARLDNEIRKMLATLAQLAQSRKGRRSNSFGLGPFFLLVGVFMIWAAQGAWISLLLGLMSVAGGIFMLYEGATLFSESDEEAQLRRQIADARAELERHQQIVKS